MELPPLVACEIELRLLVLLGVVVEVSLWHTIEGSVEPIVSVGEGAESRRARATARSSLRGGGMLSMLGARSFRSALVRRFRTPCAAIVARVSGPVARADAYLATTAAAMSVIYERELLLDRSAERERLLVRAGEQRLMRIGFDLHDGPIQDVLSLGAEVTLLRDQVYPVHHRNAPRARRGALRRHPVARHGARPSAARALAVTRVAEHHHAPARGDPPS